MKIPAEKHWELSCAVEGVRVDIERTQRLLRVCADALQLASIPEISHVTEILDELAEATWNMIQPAKDVEASLFKTWKELSAAETAAQQAQEQQAWRDSLPDGAVEAFQQVNAVFHIQQQEGEA